MWPSASMRRSKGRDRCGIGFASGFEALRLLKCDERLLRPWPSLAVNFAVIETQVLESTLDPSCLVVGIEVPERKVVHFLADRTGIEHEATTSRVCRDGLLDPTVGVGRPADLLPFDRKYICEVSARPAVGKQSQSQLRFRTPCPKTVTIARLALDLLLLPFRNDDVITGEQYVWIAPRLLEACVPRM